MWSKLLFCLFLVLFPVAMVVGEDDASNASGAPGAKLAAVMADGTGAPDAKTEPESSGEPDAKMVSGMSILGNKEAPMSLFIVPWKTSELGAETNLTRTLNERQVPVDRDVFLREMAFYQVGAGGRDSAPAVSQLLNSR